MSNPPLVLLFVPGHRERMVAKAHEIDVDAVVFDLEDSVPANQKQEAREQVRQALDDWDAGGPRPFVRVNPPRAGVAREDAAVFESHPDVGVVIPKVDRSLEVEVLGEPMALAQREVIVTIETPRSLFHLEELADHRLVDGLCLGGEDLAFGLGMNRTPEAYEFDLPRFLIVAASRAAEIRAYDSICPEFRDVDILRADALRGAASGMDGKFAIHPAQAPVIRDAFQPPDSELLRAGQIVNAYDEAVARGEGAVAFEGQMIDPPVAERFRAIVHRWNRSVSEG
ncbi:aldolase/citrate lyase family protein [soil metagenome]